MKKQTTVNAVTILDTGRIEVRFAKQVIDDDGSVLANEWHRVAIEPGVDVDAIMAVVNEHLGLLKCEPVCVDGIAQIKTYADLAHTPEAVAAFQEKQAAEEKARRVLSAGKVDVVV